jgi:5-oxoprolinase (ATP-hydrolysing)
VDFSDAAPAAPESEAFALTPGLVKTAVAIAFGHAAKRPDDAADLLGVIEVICPDTTWVGAAHPGDNPAAVAMAMARVFDVVMGALGNVWPRRVGAGSCSLGAIVELSAGSEVFTEVLPGGEGATPDRPGRHAWSGPILETRTPVSLPGWLSVQQLPRKSSGGVGARNGGDGIVRRYQLSETVAATVAIDRVHNPPHGIDRAGPPEGSEMYVEGPDHAVRAVPRWEPFEIPAGHTLVVATCGGAGHGFPGYGEIEWRPD